MNILWFASHFRTGNSAGSVRTWQIAQYLVDHGHTINVICPSHDPLNEENKIKGKASIANEEWVDGVKVLWVFSTPNDRSSKLSRYLYYFSQAVSSFLVGIGESRPDAIIAASTPLSVVVVARIIATLRNIPFIYEVRDIPVEAALKAKYINKLFGKLLLVIEKIIYNTSQGIIAISPGIKKYLLDLGISGDKIYVNTNGYDEIIDNALIDRDAVRTRLGWIDKFVIVYSGSLGWLADIKTLLETAKLMKDCEDILFAIVGDGQNKDSYQKYCLTNGLENVIFFGQRPKIEVPEFCVAADVCVHLFPKDPFWGHMFGNKTFDYLGSGTPYIYAGTENSDTASLLNDSKAGFVVEPENPKALRDGIQKLHRMTPAEREFIGNLGRHHVVKHYSRQKLSKDFEEILKEVICKIHEVESKSKKS